MSYVGNIKDRITVDVTVKTKFDYEKPSFSGWGVDYHTIYVMEDSSGNVYKWDTTGLGLSFVEDDKPMAINKGDRVTIKGTVKAHSLYKEVEQTVLSRVSVVKMIERAETKEERIARIRKSQLDSLSGEDFVWKMPYRQYKEHYSDCETICCSYDSGVRETSRGTIKVGVSTIEVIIREGRLVNSGVRGKHFHSYAFKNELGQTVAYVAVCEENAFKRVCKEHPDHCWEFFKQYW